MVLQLQNIHWKWIRKIKDTVTSTLLADYWRMRISGRAFPKTRECTFVCLLVEIAERTPQCIAQSVLKIIAAYDRLACALVAAISLQLTPAVWHIVCRGVLLCCRVPPDLFRR